MLPSADDGSTVTSRQYDGPLLYDGQVQPVLLCGYTGLDEPNGL